MSTENSTADQTTVDSTAVDSTDGTAQAPEQETSSTAEVTETDEQVDGQESPPAASGDIDDDTDTLVQEGEVAADFLEALLDIADLSGDLEVDVDGSRAAVAIVDSEDGAAPTALVGQGGKVLDALQELTRLAVQAETGERSRLMLDVAGYRADRRAALVKTAQASIEEVKSSGERVALEAMTAFERKVVHDEVLAAGLHSESEGAEPNRYVVITSP